MFIVRIPSARPIPPPKFSIVQYPILQFCYIVNDGSTRQPLRFQDFMLLEGFFDQKLHSLVLRCQKTGPSPQRHQPLFPSGVLCDGSIFVLI